MKKYAAFLADTLLFSLLLLTVGMAFVFIGSYLDILFKLKAEAPPLLYILSVLWIATSLGLYYLPKRRYGSLPGSAVVVPKEETGRRPIIFYAVVMAVLLLSYFAAQLVNETIFGRMASKQEQKLATAGMSLDWKSYFPNFPYADPDNAGPLLEKAGKNFGNDLIREADRLWSMAIGTEGWNYSEFTSDVAKLSASAAKPSAEIDTALRHKKLLWNDYRGMKDHELFSARMPQFAPLRAYARLKMLEVIVFAGRSDWSAARINASRVQALSTLLKQDPTMIGALIRFAALNTLFDGLMVSLKTAPDRHASLEFVRKVAKDLPDVEGDIRRSLMLEYAGIAAAQQAVAGDAVLLLDLYVAQNADNRKLKHVVSWYYRCFNNWDRYILLRTMEHHARIASERDPLQRKMFRDELDVFVADRYRLPALMTAVASPSFASYADREAQIGMRKDVCLLFASALDYKRKHGRYPATLDKLVPAYLPALPLNPLDGKPYGYRTGGDSLEVFAEDAEGKRLPLPSFIGTRSE